MNPYMSSPYAHSGGFMPQEQSSMSSPANSKKRQANNSCRSVTVKQLLDAVHDQENSTFTIDNQEVSSVVCIGNVRNITQQSTNKTFVIEDGTGVIEARQWTNDNSSTGDEITTDAILVRENMYVCIIGSLRMVNQKRNLNVYSIEPVTDYNRITFHLLDAIATHLYFVRGPPGMGNKTISATGDHSAYMPQQQQQQQLGGGEFPPVQEAIFRFLKKFDKHPEGVNINMMVKSVAAEGFPAQVVRDSVDTLLGDGHLYNTSDECCKAAF